MRVIADRGHVGRRFREEGLGITEDVRSHQGSPGERSTGPFEPWTQCDLAHTGGFSRRTARE